jgi:rod shape determining protein RodA
MAAGHALFYLTPYCIFYMQILQALIEPRHRKNIDWLLIFAVVALMGWSLLAIYSARMGRMTPTGQHDGMQHIIKQGAAYLTGLLLMGYVATRDYALLSRFAPILYWINSALLAIVMLIGKSEVLSGASTKGSARWIPLGGGFKLQPSELAKVILILTLSLYVMRLGPRIKEFPNLLKTLLHIGLPMVLIMKQPDLGTSLVVAAIWLGIVFLAGADWRQLLLLLAAGGLLFGIGWKTHLLQDYQRKRIEVLYDIGLPKEQQRKDLSKERYQIEQSLPAVGGGQVTGQGFRSGLQTGGAWVPENWTDFVFTVVAEESGFVGAALLLSLYALLLWRGISSIAETEDALGRLVAGGVTTYLAFHVLVNIGMTCGIVPVVGVPLPLMSFGGSAAWTNCTAIGLLLSVHMRKKKLQF